MIKALGIVLVIIAILVGVIPAFNNCSAEGLFITTADGRQIDMKCFWTSRAEIGVAVPLGIAGLFIALSRRKETQGMLAFLTGLLSAGALALPTVLIGVCAMDKSCSNVMRPSLIVLGVLGIIVSAVILALSQRRADDDAAAAA